MNENMISVATRMYNPDQLFDMSLFDVLGAIQKGNLYGYDLIGITQKIQSLTDKEKRNELKYLCLPVAMFNGTFRYKNNNSLKSYSHYTAIDFDELQSYDDMRHLANRLMKTPCVISFFITASGRGMKAIIGHDCDNPDYHDELYGQLLKKFHLDSATGETDASCRDLARGNYINYDPNLWINSKHVPYHFEHDPNYVPKPKAANTYNGMAYDVGMMKWYLSTTTVIRKKSDESIISILNSYWKKKQPERWTEGHRAISIFKGASELCSHGVEFDKALNYMTKEYIPTGLNDEEIFRQTYMGYANNMDKYGTTRNRFDNYGL